MYEDFKPTTPEELLHTLKTNDMNVGRYLCGAQMVMPYPTRLALNDAVNAHPDRAASWICYAMSHITATAAINLRDQNALKDDLAAARARIARLEESNHKLRDDGNAAEMNFNNAVNQLEAVSTALDALKRQIAMHVTDSAAADKLRAQIDLIQDITNTGQE